MFESRVFRANQVLGRGSLNLSRQNKRHGMIYNRGKGRRRFYEGPGNRGS